MAERLTPVVALAGPPVRRGEAYGESVRDLVRAAAERWRDRIGRGLRVPLGDYVAELVDRSGFRAAALRHCPGLLEEVTGLARGSGVDARTLFAMNLLDEEWWLRRRFSAGEAAAHCSSFGIEPSAGRPAYVGQNMDLPAWMDGLQVLLDVRPDDEPAALVPSWAGMLALGGVNEHGVGVCVNTLAQLPTSTSGLPVAFVIRMLLAQPDRQHALAVLTAVPHASGQNYVVGDPTGVSDVECSAVAAVPYVAPTPWVAHTNHPLAGPPEAIAAPPDNSSQDRTVQRLAQLSQRLGALTEPDVNALAGVLAEPPLCRGSDGDRGFTLYATVIELSDAPVLHLSAGPPSSHRLVPFPVPQPAGQGVATKEVLQP